jgi:hypothetical protein
MRVTPPVHDARSDAAHWPMHGLLSFTLSWNTPRWRGSALYTSMNLSHCMIALTLLAISSSQLPPRPSCCPHAQIHFSTIDLELHARFTPGGSESVFDMDAKVAARTQVGVKV